MALIYVSKSLTTVHRAYDTVLPWLPPRRIPNKPLFSEVQYYESLWDLYVKSICQFLIGSVLITFQDPLGCCSLMHDCREQLCRTRNRSVLPWYHGMWCQPLLRSADGYVLEKVNCPLRFLTRVNNSLTI